MTGESHDLQPFLESLDKAGHSLVFAAEDLRRSYCSQAPGVEAAKLVIYQLLERTVALGAELDNLKLAVDSDNQAQSILSSIKQESSNENNAESL